MSVNSISNLLTSLITTTTTASATEASLTTVSTSAGSTSTSSTSGLAGSDSYDTAITLANYLFDGNSSSSESSNIYNVLTYGINAKVELIQNSSTSSSSS